MKVDSFIALAKEYWPQPKWTGQQEFRMERWLSCLEEDQIARLFDMAVEKFRLRPLVADMASLRNEDVSGVDTGKENEKCIYCQSNGWIEHPTKPNVATRCPVCH